MRIAFLILCSIITVSSAALGQASSSITLPPELDRVLRDYEKSWRAGDENGLAAVFTPDGFVPSNSGWVRGRDGIRTQYKDQQGDLQLRALAYAVSDTVGYIVGAFGFGTDGVDRGKYVLALRRPRGGQWLIAADIDQSNRGGPASSPEQAAEREAVRRAALDYLEGFYEGDSSKIARSVRTDVRKTGYYREGTGPYAPDEMPFKAMIDYTNNFKKAGRTTPATAPREVIVGEINDQTATAKVVAWWGIDYLHLAKYDGKWMIVNVIWQSPPPKQGTE